LLTGDSALPAERVATELGVDVEHTMAPLEKAAWVRSSSGRTVFVGDGVNDAPALGAADVGIAMSSGAAATVLASDGVVAGNELGPVLAGLTIARRTRLAVRRSRWRSVVYNVVAVSAAAAGFVNPLVAAVLMPLSSLAVALEALRIDR